MTPVSLKPATPQSPVKHFTTKPYLILPLHFDFFSLYKTTNLSFEPITIKLSGSVGEFVHMGRVVSVFIACQCDKPAHLY